MHNLQKSRHSVGFAMPARRIGKVHVNKKRGELSLVQVLVPFERDNIRISMGTSYARFHYQQFRGVGSRPTRA